MKCPNCNHQIPSDSKFCPDCGCRVHEHITPEPDFDIVHILRKKLKSRIVEILN